MNDKLQTWYLVSFGEITPVRVSKVTEKFVYTTEDGYRERRNAISSGWGTYYPTRAEAVAALTRKYQDSIEMAQRQAAQAAENLHRLAQEYPAEFAAANAQAVQP